MSHADQPKEKGKTTMNTADMSRFVNDFRYALEGERQLSCCVDGRMVESEELAPAARPGADAGDLMAALAALRALDVPDIKHLHTVVLTTVVHAAGGARRFRFHTDEHAAYHEGEPREVIARGCGHLKQAEIDPHAYGLEPEDMKAIFECLLWLRDEGAKEVVLEGKHGETAVLVVDSDTFGVRHGDGHSRQAFVYHATLNRERLKELAGELAKIRVLKGVHLNDEDILAALVAASDRQRNETLTRLAKGLPVYEVTRDGVAFLGNV